MDNNVYDLLNYNKWNRKLINLYWVFSAIVLVIEIVIAVYYYDSETGLILSAPLPYYIWHIIILPCVFMLLMTLACKTVVRLLQKNHRYLQPYIITFTCVAISTTLITVHYGINVIFVTCVIPIIFSLAYDDKNVLFFTLIFSFAGLIGAVIHLNYHDMPIKLDFAEIVTNLAILLVVYLICKTILNRFREIIYSMAEAAGAKTRAEATAETRTRILANMSHEIRTPMNSIIGLTELALDGGADCDKEEYLVKIRNSAVGLLDIVNDILDMSKLEAGEVILKKRPFELNRILDECETIIASEAQQKGLTLYFRNETNFESDIIGDPTRLRQALINILSNAVKFTHSGTVTLFAGTGRAHTDTGKASVYFEISDTGIGIAEEQFEEIFEPFKQVDDSVSRCYGGTGLGLAITKGIIEAMGGKIKVDSIRSMGSRFSFTLEFELLDSNAAVDIEDKIVERPIFFGEILLCEDEPINQQVAVQNLERLGLRVVVAENGKAAVDIAGERQRQGRPFDLIFMDINMPVMDGMQATKKLVEMNVKTPIIAMTANVMADDKKTYLASGITECLCKPFRARELWDCLSRHITPAEIVATPLKKLKAQ